MEPSTEDFLSLDESILAYADPQVCKMQPQGRSASDSSCNLKEAFDNNENSTRTLSACFHQTDSSFLERNGFRVVSSAQQVQQETDEWNMEMLKSLGRDYVVENVVDSFDVVSTGNPKSEWTLMRDQSSNTVESVPTFDGSQYDSRYWKSDGFCNYMPQKVERSWEYCNEHFMTLPLCILEFMRNIGRPVSEEEILEEARKKYSILRKSDGSRYKENQIRAVKGSLCSTGIFMKAEENGKEWIVNEEAAKQYEAKMLHKQGSLSRKWHSWNSRKGFQKRTRKLGMEDTRIDAVSVEEGQWIPPKCCSCCFYCCPCLHEEPMETTVYSRWNWLMSISNEMREDPRWNGCFENPFEGSRPECSLKELEDVLGTEKLVHVMQTFHWIKELFICSDSKHSPGRVFPSSPMKTNRRPIHFISSPYEQQVSLSRIVKNSSPYMERRNYPPRF